MFQRRHILIASVPVLASLALALGANGCSGAGSTYGAGSEGGTSEAGPAEGGGGICASPGGSAASQVAVQSVSDYSQSASKAVVDATTSCKAIAQGLGAPAADQSSAEAASDKGAQMKAWCALAVTAIGASKAVAGGTLRIETVAPTCEGSIELKGNCQARCAGTGTCDLKVNPPKCTGGSLMVACKGDCTGRAGAAVKCEGDCSGSCKGSCNAPGGVQCAGKCAGVCSAAGGGGPQADGTCSGLCKGTCAVTAPGVVCGGICNGQCDASCRGSADAPVKCDGSCNADYDLLTCNGGKLEGGCKVDARCDASCDTIVVAKAACPAHEVLVSISGAANLGAATKLKSTLEANLGALVSLNAQLENMSRVSAAVAGSAGAISDINAECIPGVIKAASGAVEDVQVALTAVSSVTRAVDMS